MSLMCDVEAKALKAVDNLMNFYREHPEMIGKKLDLREINDPQFTGTAADIYELYEEVADKIIEAGEIAIGRRGMVAGIDEMCEIGNQSLDEYYDSAEEFFSRLRNAQQIEGGARWD